MPKEMRSPSPGGEMPQRPGVPLLSFDPADPYHRPTGPSWWKNTLWILAALASLGVVAALGVDTFEDDPICTFGIASTDYLRVGAAIATAGLPTVFVMEGGYAAKELGVNVANVLDGFETR